MRSVWRRVYSVLSGRFSEGPVRISGIEYPTDEVTNITPTIVNKVGRNLHQTPNHPVNIIKQRVVSHFHRRYTNKTGNAIFAHFDNVRPVVTTEQNFDSLLVPKNHVCRSRNDNYYINSTHLLRTHTSAHQRDFVGMGLDRFLVTGDVYRRDEIDSSHYPVFHQMEGVRLFTRHELFHTAQDDSLHIFERDKNYMYETEEKQAEHTLDAAKMVELDLKRTLEELVKEIFGTETETRWVPCYFPFTHPSFELEIKFKGEWMEMLGSGVMRQGILQQGGANNKVGWAFGLGLDRLAMLLFDIPDIRLLWSEDNRFIDQFKNVGLNPSTNIQFVPYSKYPPSCRDIAFWVSDRYSENDFYEIVRNIGGDFIEKVELIDTYQHPVKKDKTSFCYRITYRSMDRSLTNEEVNEIQDTVRRSVVEQLLVKLR